MSGAADGPGAAPKEPEELPLWGEGESDFTDSDHEVALALKSVVSKVVTDVNKHEKTHWL